MLPARMTPKTALSRVADRPIAAVAHRHGVRPPARGVRARRRPRRACSRDRPTAAGGSQRNGALAARALRLRGAVTPIAGATRRAADASPPRGDHRHPPSPPPPRPIGPNRGGALARAPRPRWLRRRPRRPPASDRRDAADHVLCPGGVRRPRRHRADRLRRHRRRPQPRVGSARSTGQPHQLRGPERARRPAPSGLRRAGRTHPPHRFPAPSGAARRGGAFHVAASPGGAARAPRSRRRVPRAALR